MGRDDGAVYCKSYVHMSRRLDKSEWKDGDMMPGPAVIILPSREYRSNHTPHSNISRR